MTTTDPGTMDLERVYRIADSMDKAIGIPNLDDGTLLRELAAAVKTLRDDLADLEALRAEDHAAIRQTILEKKVAETREVELAEALKSLTEWIENSKGEGGDDFLNEGGWDDLDQLDVAARAALAAMPVQVMERARAVKAVAIQLGNRTSAPIYGRSGVIESSATKPYVVRIYFRNESDAKRCSETIAKLAALSKEEE